MPRTRPNNKKDHPPIEELRGQILKWYDRNKRSLPWRMEGKRQDPYKVWLSEIMLQQTTVAAVKSYYTKFIALWPDVQSLASAPLEDVLQQWAGLGYYARARNLHKCANVIVREYAGCFPEKQDQLKNLPGIGDYTSAAIAAIAFDQPAAVMDTNIERVIARFYALTQPLPKAKPQFKGHVSAWFEGMQSRAGDFAQALMDLGAQICTPQAPKCPECPLSSTCTGLYLGIARDLPQKTPKKTRPLKHAIVYWVENSAGQILLHKRAERGMLAQMRGFPTSEWVEDTGHLKDPEGFSGAMDTGLAVRHTFTHFNLVLSIKRLKMQSGSEPQDCFWQARNSLAEAGLPTLFKKVYHLCEKD